VTLEIDTGSGLMPVHVWEGSGPGLLLLQEIFGVSDYIQERGAQLSTLGYHVVAPEIFWRLDDVDLDPNAPDLLDRALAVVGRLDWGLAVSDSVAALEYLRGRDAGVGVIGFCFGGGLGFNVAAVSSPDVLVSYYGSALPDLLPLAPDVTAASLHHFGDVDEYLPPETVDKIVAELGDAEVHRYPGAGHAFDNPMPAFHHAEASAQAWQRTTAFLSRHLPAEGNE
jgi:carboxymethylenebutenolidase